MNFASLHFFAKALHKKTRGYMGVKRKTHKGNMIGIHKNHPTAYFDGIRGIAVLIVWFSHTSGRGQSLSEWLSFQGIGHIGVMLFFVLSGYLLSLPFETGRSFSFKNYLIRRFLRIAPLYYLLVTAVIVYQLITGLVHTKYLHITEGLEGFVKHILFLKGDGIFWTIPAEFMFYLVLPFVAIFLLKGTFFRYASVFGIASAYSIYHVLLYIGLIEVPSIKIVDINKHSQYLDVFLIGVFFGMLSKESAIKEFYVRNKFGLDKAILILFLLIIATSIILVSKDFLYLNQPFYHFRFLSGLFAVVFGLALLSSQLGNTYLRNLFTFKPFIFCGVVGYSWYLLHFIVIQFLNEFSVEPWVKFVMGTFLISLISLASYKFVEEPFIKLGKRISTKRLTNISKGLPCARL